MAYDKGLAERLMDLSTGMAGTSEKRMFGGWGLMLHGNLLIGVMGDEICARVGVDAYEDALAQPHARPFDFTKRPMKGWVYVSPDALESDEGLQTWFDRCHAFVSTLPKK